MVPTNMPAAASADFDRWQRETAEWIDASTKVPETIGALHRLLSATSSDLRIVIAKDDPRDPPLRRIEWREIPGENAEYTIPLDPMILSNDQARSLARQLDKGEFRTQDRATEMRRASQPARMRKESDSSLLASPLVIEHMERFAAMLFEQFGDRVLDLSGALLHRVAKNHWTVGPDTPRSIVPPADFRDALEEALRSPSLDVPQQDALLREILGERRFVRLLMKYPERQKMLRHLRELLLRKSSVRRHLFSVLRQWTRAPERQLAAAIVQQGNRELTKTMEIPDLDYCKFLVDAQRILIRQSKANEQFDFEYLAALEQSHRRLLAEETSSAIRTLRERIGCDNLREEFRRAARTGSSYDYSLLQRVAAEKVFREVARYRALPSDGTNAVPEDARRGFPVNVAKNQVGSCFGGLWLLTAMLRESGFGPQEFFYCKVHKLHDGILGNHASLLLATTNKDYYVFDHGYNISGGVFPLDQCTSRKGIRDAKRILDFRSKDAVSLRMHPDLAATFKIHRALQLMPLREGFCSNHLLAVALDAVRQGQHAEADLLLEWAASFNPHDPDILYHQGISHFKKGELDEAERLLKRAISIFDEHLQSHFALGELMLARGDKERAKEYFSTVSLNGNRMYGDAPFHAMAVDKMGELLGIDEKMMDGLKSVATLFLRHATEKSTDLMA